MNAKTLIGCEAIIKKDDNILLGQRGPAAFGANTWALPGGHLEFMESTEDCIIREIKEELGIKVSKQDINFISITNDLQPEANKHYVHISYLVNIGTKKFSVCEPESCLEWKWFKINSLPRDIFPPHQKIFNNILSLI